MAGPVPAINVFVTQRSKSWITGLSPVMTLMVWRLPNIKRV
jgi:hypothetical protein